MKMIPGKWYYVDDDSCEKAVEDGEKRIFSCEKDGSMLFEHREIESILIPWRYAVPVEENQEMDEIKEGDEVYVSDDSIEYALKWKSKRIYLMTTKQNIHICVDERHEDNYKNGLPFIPTTWKYIVPVPKQTELTMAQIAEKFGVPVDQLRIKE